MAGGPDRSLPRRRPPRMALAALGFTAWHLVPLANQGTPARRQLSLLAGAALIGLGYGWIAQQSGSLRGVSPAHALTDSCGVRQAHTTWLTEGA